MPELASKIKMFFGLAPVATVAFYQEPHDQTLHLPGVRHLGETGKMSPPV
uniref:Uncharacterized protein n=1 Tax=Anguilla anguilla TaxID=7936 RepID=A0A0E9SLK4_ANGAN